MFFLFSTSLEPLKVLDIKFQYALNCIKSLLVLRMQASKLNEFVFKVQRPCLFRNVLKNNSCCDWTPEKLVDIFQADKFTFRIGERRNENCIFFTKKQSTNILNSCRPPKWDPNGTQLYFMITVRLVFYTMWTLFWQTIRV